MHDWLSGLIFFVVDSFCIRLSTKQLIRYSAQITDTGCLDLSKIRNDINV